MLLKTSKQWKMLLTAIYSYATEHHDDIAAVKAFARNYADAHEFYQGDMN